MPHPDQSAQRRFSAARWEVGIADTFLSWRSHSGVALELMETFGQAVSTTVRSHAAQHPQNADQLALHLCPVLKSCDQLDFESRWEVASYTALHLLDRYGRVSQVLQFLLRQGCLPLRKLGVSALEIGAGPAPALYATRDFYGSLVQWPHRGETSFGELNAFHTLDRGPAWDRLLHQLSEQLLLARQHSRPSGPLSFGRSVHEFMGFNVWQRHHEERARIARDIVSEFDRADEAISTQEANRRAYEERTGAPSAYDLVFLCNFLTHPSMPVKFAKEMLDLAQALTPGGVLIILGGTGRQYPAVFAEIHRIAATCRLVDISPTKEFEANDEVEQRALVARFVRGDVRWMLDRCTDDVRARVEKELPSDLLDTTVPFDLPRFRVAAFVRRSRRRMRTSG